MIEAPIPLEQSDPEVADLIKWYCNLSHAERAKMDGINTVRNTAPEVGRNDPCPCGSGKKYKKCCGVK